MKTDKQLCPICNKDVQPNLRYPKYVCHDCCAKATDKDGRRVIFGNIDMGGGCEGLYLDTKEKYEDTICYIEGHECIADEARFGGIVIEIR
jgi:hypothetical protein